MTNKQLTKLCIICGLAGAFLYGIHKGWIIFNTPFSTPQHKSTSNQLPTTIQKKVILYFWHNEAWHHETTPLVWSEHAGQNTFYLINSWLSLLEDEKITPKKVSLQTALFNDSGAELYISFDRSLTSKESKTHDKWMLIEGLLKTLRENGINPQSVRFLVHHQPMVDAHLDFSAPWPINGFIRN